jgi:hypothetical protein
VGGSPRRGSQIHRLCPRIHDMQSCSTYARCHRTSGRPWKSSVSRAGKTLLVRWRARARLG